MDDFERGGMVIKLSMMSETSESGSDTPLALPTATFAGEGACFLETGSGTAAMVTGSFLADPPAVRLTDASPEHLMAKRAFEADRLAAWFGG